MSHWELEEIYHSYESGNHSYTERKEIDLSGIKSILQNWDIDKKTVKDSLRSLDTFR